MFAQRFRHYVLLLLVGSALCFPNLGKPSLWDIDEGNNAEAAREMLESGNWTTPTFNYELRVDKPALLYWLQIGSFRLFGVNELAARFPSAVAALVTLLLCYELGRRLFNGSTGLLGALILAGTPGCCAAAHFANPDALLNCFTLFTLCVFWLGVTAENRLWFLGAGLATGLAVLAKGPVGLVLPGAVVFLYLFSTGRLGLLWSRYHWLGILTFCAVALPWYIWVGVETRCHFLTGFIGVHNVGRFLNPMENHSGPAYYYVLVIILGMAPWSVFLGPAVWYAWRGGQSADEGNRDGQGRGHSPYRFLWCWIAVYLMFFSVSRTKLPNYILPAYAPLAILLARFLERWRRGSIAVPAWVIKMSFACMALLGVAVIAGTFSAAGVVDVAALRSTRMPNLKWMALWGVLPIAGAVAGMWYLRQSRRDLAVTSILTTGLIFVGGLFGTGSGVLEDHKAPRELVETSGARQEDREIRVAVYDYFEPSLVFYCRREVKRLDDPKATADFLRSVWPVYVFVPIQTWNELEPKIAVAHAVVARHYDLYRRCEVAVIANQAALRPAGFSRLSVLRTE
jgi:4-amino-4-deoxy-L-arabinose transferase-like glycosyltransferase